MLLKIEGMNTCAKCLERYLAIKSHVSLSCFYSCRDWLLFQPSHLNRSSAVILDSAFSFYSCIQPLPILSSIYFFQFTTTPSFLTCTTGIVFHWSPCLCFLYFCNNCMRYNSHTIYLFKVYRSVVFSNIHRYMQPQSILDLFFLSPRKEIYIF